MEAFSSLQAALDCSLVPTHFDVKDPKMCVECCAIYCGECLKKCKKPGEKKIKCAFCRNSALYVDYVSLSWHEEVNELVKQLQAEHSQQLGQINFLRMENKDLRKRLRDSSGKPAVLRGKKSSSEQPRINSLLAVTDHLRTTKTTKITSAAGENTETASGDDSFRRWTRSMGDPGKTQHGLQEDRAQAMERPGPSNQPHYQEEEDATESESED